jgi:hypothetical protein
LLQPYQLFCTYRQLKSLVYSPWTFVLLAYNCTLLQWEQWNGMGWMMAWISGLGECAERVKRMLNTLWLIISMGYNGVMNYSWVGDYAVPLLIMN